MTTQPISRTIKRLLVYGFLGLGLTGCDYWPPALQAQIEQMQVEAQLATAERAKLQGQLTDMLKMKEELQVRVDELTRVNREFSGRVSTLEHTISMERDKANRLAKVSHKPAPAKTIISPIHKPSSQKKSLDTKTKTGHKRRG